jgi:hypothetical protein
MRRSHAPLALVLLLGLSVAACSRDPEFVTTARSSATGQDLINLNQAYDKGLIGKGDYSNRRGEILARLQ